MMDSRFIDLSEQKSGRALCGLLAGRPAATKFVELSRRIIVSPDSAA
jgi:hypothetical protein